MKATDGATWKTWHIPLCADGETLGAARADLRLLGAEQADIPLLVQLTENPRYDLPGIDLFHGAVDLETHDYIHIILGRGLLSMDEAFVIGFTMGSTNKVSTTEERLYSWVSKFLYPKLYRFNDTDLAVFRDAVRLGYISDCTPLNEVDYHAIADLPLRDVRRHIGLERDLLEAYFRIERRRYPESSASQRLLPGEGTVSG